MNHTRNNLHHSRRAYRAISVPLWGLLWNGLGAAVILPVYCFEQLNNGTETHFEVSVDRARVMVATLVLAALAPVYFMMHSAGKQAAQHQLAVAAFQVTPVFVSLVQQLLSRLFKTCWTSSKPGSDIAYLRRVYLVGSLAALVGHVYSMAVTLLATEPAMRFTRVYIPNPSSVVSATDSELLGHGALLFLQYDWMLMNLCCMVWLYALLRPHFTYHSLVRHTILLMCTAISTLLFGPGFVVSIGLWWREALLPRGLL